MALLGLLGPARGRDTRRGVPESSRPLLAGELPAHLSTHPHPIWLQAPTSLEVGDRALLPHTQLMAGESEGKEARDNPRPHGQLLVSSN